MASAVRQGAEYTFGPPVPLFRTDPTARRFAVSDDGQRFLFNRLREGDQQATTTTLHVVLNWPGLLTR